MQSGLVLVTVTRTQHRSRTGSRLSDVCDQIARRTIRNKKSYCSTLRMKCVSILRMFRTVHNGRFGSHRSFHVVESRNPSPSSGTIRSCRISMLITHVRRHVLTLQKPSGQRHLRNGGTRELAASSTSRQYAVA